MKKTSNSQNARNDKLQLLLHRHSSPRSVFWEYVCLYTILMVITGTLLALLLGGSYLRTLNRHRKDTLQKQAHQAVSALDSQIDSMYRFSNKLSSQPIFWRSSVEKKIYNKLLIADSLKNYQSYSPLASSFGLLYQNTNGSVTLFQDDGTTADLNVFLSGFNVSDTNDVYSFLFDSVEKCRILLVPDGMLIAYPISSKPNCSDATLCFYVSLDDISQWIEQASGIQLGGYTLCFQGNELLTVDAEKNYILDGDESGWQISINVPTVSLLTLLNNRFDTFLFLIILFLLTLAVFALSWYCYQPVLQLTQQFSTEPSHTVTSKNEFIQLQEAIGHLQCRSDALAQEASAQVLLLRSYFLLMLINGTCPAEQIQDRKNLGISFPYSWFAVLTILPCSDQSITNENIDALLQNLPEISGSDDVLYAVECNHDNHMLAVVCNMREKGDFDQIVRRLHIYLSHLPRRFLVAEGSITNVSSISASYLTAKSKLKLMATAQIHGKNDTADYEEDIQQLADQLVFQIECGDCQRALDTLEHCMKLMRRSDSEITRRYNIMNLTTTIRRFCSRVGFSLSDEQLSMLLPSNNLQSIHYEMLQLIPFLCSNMTRRNEQAIQPISQLVMDYLDEHFCDYDISAKKIAEETGIGINRIYAIIREQTGQSHKTILTQMRIQQAKKLLLNSDASITEIAEAIGYGSSSYFIKVFKSSVGLPPDAYRKTVFSDEADIDLHVSEKPSSDDVSTTEEADNSY